MTQPWPDVSNVRRKVMQANKGKDTKPEMAVRRLLHAMGYRFRLHRRDLPGTPDIAFPVRRKVVLVHGCFWHQHEGCRHGRVPATRREYWLPKLTRNKERDEQSAAALAVLGWQCATVWECEVKDAEAVANRLDEFLGGRRGARPSVDPFRGLECSPDVG